MEQGKWVNEWGREAKRYQVQNIAWICRAHQEARGSQAATHQGEQGVTQEGIIALEV